MYFSRENLNDTDQILQKRKPVEIAELIAKKTSEDLLTYRFRIVLEKNDYSLGGLRRDFF